MKRRIIAKAQKKKRRNKAKHSGRMSKLDYLAKVDFTPSGTPSFDNTLELVTTMTALLAMKKHRARSKESSSG